MIHAKLVNGSFGDPFVYCSLPFVGKAFCFDMGASFSMANREMQRVEAVYISHAHMDHVFGFDYFLRANLKQKRRIQIYGPAGIQKNIHGKLKGFTWNLVHGYGLVFDVYEIRKKSVKKYTLRSKEKFKLELVKTSKLSDKPVQKICKNNFYQVTTTTLDHRIPSQAYAVTENLAFSINKDQLQKHGWIPGDWLQELKKVVLSKKPLTEKLSVPTVSGKSETKSAAVLKDLIMMPKKRMKIAYVTDAAISKTNRERILALAEGADLFFCESAFTHDDLDKAKTTRHMTAKEVGNIANEAGCDRLVIFHFGKKYLADPKQIIDEASESFGKEVEAYPEYQTHYDYTPAFANEVDHGGPL